MATFIQETTMGAEATKGDGEMSTTMQAICDSCEEEGPRIHRVASGATCLWPKPGGDIFNEREAQNQWSAWINAHEFCDFKMVRP
jgi:hypothetical protein